MLFNKDEHEILIISPIFLKSLNLLKIKQLIVFDYPIDNKNLIRVLSKFPKDKNNTNSVQFLCSSQDLENNRYTIEYLNNLNNKTSE
jgi:hypothetical protein